MADSRDEPLVLGIETSCDETGVGIVRGTTLLADAVASSVDEHARFGGVVPEVASRAHLEAMVPTIDRALKEAGVSARDLDGVAVTAGPGLAGALLVGVSAAKAYAYALGKPLYGVNHLASHICVDQLEHGPLPEPTMALLVSGGHSSLLLSSDITSDVRPMGATIDDAAGEAVEQGAVHARPPAPVDRVDLVGRHVRHQIGLAGQQRGDAGRHLRSRAEDDPLEGRRAAPVTAEALKEEMDVEPLLREPERKKTRLKTSQPH
jgi:hypothetical protein